MLTQAEMLVVFVPREKITQGSLTNGGIFPKSIDMEKTIKCHSDDAFRKERVKRGKPRE